MNVVILFLASLWTIRIVGNFIAYIHLWYVKEYRLDRMLIHLRTKQGKNIWFLPWRKPHVSPRSISILLTCIALMAILFMLVPYDILVRFLIADAVSFPFTFLVVGLYQIPVAVYHRVLIGMAYRKLLNHQAMTVIGITGSYAKTSTKEYMATILSGKFQVLRTQASQNTPIAVAEVVLRQMSDEHNVFIVEMAAYKRGEIKKMVDMVKPSIGIVTAVNEQHQELFGSMEHTKMAKYELVEGLRGKSIAIFNADNNYTREMAAWAEQSKRKVWMYSVNRSYTNKRDAMTASHIKTSSESVSFIVHWQKKKLHVHAKVLGDHQVSNILAALLGAVASGMSFDDAAKAASSIMPFEHIMQPKLGRSGIRIIDDTFNNNPDAALAALRYLSVLPRTKILVFQPMIELGGSAQDAHRRVGEYAASVCDYIILTNNNFFEPFYQGVTSVGRQATVAIYPPKEAALFIVSHTKAGDTVLFKGKESARTMNMLLK